MKLVLDQATAPSNASYDAIFAAYFWNMISTKNPETKTRFVAQVPQVPAAAGSQVGSDSSYFRGNVIIARIRPSRPPCYTNAIHQAREILRQGSSTMLYMELIFFACTFSVHWTSLQGNVTVQYHSASHCSPPFLPCTVHCTPWWNIQWRWSRTR